MSVRKFYIRYREDMPETEMQFSALYGFGQRGVETAPFYGFGDIQELNDLGPEVGLAGYLGDVWEALSKLGFEKPASLDYPEELKKYLGREIWQTDLKTVRGITHRKLFVKPVKQKLFTGFQMTGSFNDQMRMCGIEDNEVMWLSEPVEFVSEYRCFVLRNKIVAVHHYKNDWSKAIDKNIVQQAVDDYAVNAPAAYGIDFGVTSDGKTLLVEVNDSYALGTYGLLPNLYAQMLEARWEELTSCLV